jgi:aryl-alcohol dehydrogenase-like predicted oxidoreductase
MPGAPGENDIQLPKTGKMPMRPLGRTGVKVSLIGIGGYHLGMPRDDAEATRIVHFAMDHGVTFLDNCWDYHDGKSEERMGRALSDGGRRQKAFLMTKLDGRTAQAATEQLEQSLKRLKTDVIDLVQIHEVIRLNDAERVFSPGGAIEALRAAQKEGKLRFIGFTGHKDPAIHLHMLETAKQRGFAFDTVQMPINVLDVHFTSFEKHVLPVLREQGIGVLGMKPMGSGIILESGAATAPECLRYAMSVPTSVVITGCETMGVLKQAIAVAWAFKPLTAKERKALLARTAAAAANGRFEPFKTSEQFDGTTQHPRWLETAQL